MRAGAAGTPAPDMDCIANTCAKTVFLEQVLRNPLDIMDCNAIHGANKTPIALGDNSTVSVRSDAVPWPRLWTGHSAR
jgi:hypothetical protein